MGILSIKGLRVEALIGIHPWEQVQKQELYINIDCTIDILKAAAHDRIEDALDYQQLAVELSALIEQNHFQLVETAVQCVADYLKNKKKIAHARVEIIKPHALSKAESVGVSLEW